MASSIAPLQRLSAQMGPANPGVFFKPNPVGDMAQAMSQLMQGAASFHEGLKQHNLKLYQNAVQSIVDGTNPNPDYKKILEWGRKAGLPIKTDVTPEDIQAQRQAKYQTDLQKFQDQQSQLGQIPGPTGGAVSTLQPPQPPGNYPGSAPYQPTGIAHMLQGAKRYMGLNAGQPPVDVNSPQGQFLQRLTAAAQSQGGVPNNLADQQELQQLVMHAQKINARLQSATGNNQMRVENLVPAAMNGDPTATEILHKFGRVQDTPVDALEALVARQHPDWDVGQVRKSAADTAMYLNLGGKEYQIKMFDMAQKMAPNFGQNPLKAFQFLQNPTDPNNQPGFSPDDWSKFTEGTGKLANLANVPLNVSSMLGSAYLTGNTPLAQQIEDFASKTYPLQNSNLNTQANRRLNIDETNTIGNLQLRGQEVAVQRLGKFQEMLKDRNLLPEDILRAKPGTYSDQEVVDAQRLYSMNLNQQGALMGAAGSPITPPTMTLREHGGGEKGSGLLGGITGVRPQSLQYTPPPNSLLQTGTPPSQPQSILDTPAGKQAIQTLQGLDPRDRKAAVDSTNFQNSAIKPALYNWIDQNATNPAPAALQNQVPQTATPSNGGTAVLQQLMNPQQ